MEKILYFCDYLSSNAYISTSSFSSPVLITELSELASCFCRSSSAVGAVSTASTVGLYSERSDTCLKTEGSSTRSASGCGSLLLFGTGCDCPVDYLVGRGVGTEDSVDTDVLECFCVVVRNNTPNNNHDVIHVVLFEKAQNFRDE